MQGTRGIQPNLHLPLIISISLLVYLNSINNGFTLDDNRYLINCDYIKDIRNLFAIFTPRYLEAPANQVDLNRPMMTWSLIVEYSMWGMNPAGYHITNLLLHALNSALVYILLTSTFYGKRISFLASLIFAVHPIHTEAVNGINFREDLLVTLFFLAAVVSFQRKLSRKKEGDPFFPLTTLACFIFALLSKEVAVILPAVFLLLHYIKTGDIRRSIQEGFLFYSLSFLVLLVYITGLWFLYSNTALPRGHFYEGEGPLFIPLLGRMLFYYLKLFLFPLNLSYSHDIEASASLFEPLPLLTLFMSAYIFVTAVKTLKANPEISLPTLWFFVALAPVTATFYQQPMAERFLYLPSIGPAALAAISIDRLFMRTRGEQVAFRFLYIIMLSLTICFSILTFQRNTVWKSNLLLFQSALRADPDNKRAHFNLGLYYEKSGDYEAALNEYRKAVYENPLSLMSVEMDNLLTHTGTVYLKMGNHREAISSFQKAILYNAKNIDAFYNLALAYSSMGYNEAAATELRKVIAMKPDFLLARMDLANIYLEQKRYEAAREEYQGVVKTAPRSPMAEMARRTIATFKKD